jgi:nicotinamidase-related amidase
MGPGGPQFAALVISECQRGILDPAVSVTPGLAAQAAERGIVARIAELADAFPAAGLPVVHCHIAHRPDLAGAIARITDAAAVLASLAELAELAEGEQDK